MRLCARACAYALAVMAYFSGGMPCLSCPAVADMDPVFKGGPVIRRWEPQSVASARWLLFITHLAMAYPIAVRWRLIQFSVQLLLVLLKSVRPAVASIYLLCQRGAGIVP
jgi:hypothetical protein